MRWKVLESQDCLHMVKWSLTCEYQYVSSYYLMHFLHSMLAQIEETRHSEAVLSHWLSWELCRWKSCWLNICFQNILIINTPAAAACHMLDCACVRARAFGRVCVGVCVCLWVRVCMYGFFFEPLTVYIYEAWPWAMHVFMLKNYRKKKPKVLCTLWLFRAQFAVALSSPVAVSP